MKSLKTLLNYNGFSNKVGHKKLNRKGEQSDIFDFLDLVKNWSDIVGPNLSQSTIPLKLLNKNLTVLTSHPVFAQQLSFMEKVIIKKIEERFPALKFQMKKIFFQADNKHFQKKKELHQSKEKVKETFEQSLHKHSPEYKALAKEAENLLIDVSDNELKESLKSLFIQIRNHKD